MKSPYPYHDFLTYSAMLYNLKTAPFPMPLSEVRTRARAGRMLPQLREMMPTRRIVLENPKIQLSSISQGLNGSENPAGIHILLMLQPSPHLGSLLSISMFYSYKQKSLDLVRMLTVMPSNRLGRWGSSQQMYLLSQFALVLDSVT